MDLELRALSAHRGDPEHYARIKRLTPGERLEEAAEWQDFASEIRGKAGRAAGAG